MRKRSYRRKTDTLNDDNDSEYSVCAKESASSRREGNNSVLLLDALSFFSVEVISHPGMKYIPHAKNERESREKRDKSGKAEKK